MNLKMILVAVCCVVASMPSAAMHGHKARPAVKEQKPWGIAGDARAAQRTIEVVMTDDMRFTPARIDVKQSETVRFVLKNNGKLLHEFVLGTKKELDQHAAQMAKGGAMQHHAADAAHVAPGKTAELIWNFNQPGAFDFACLIAGHYQAGMVGKIEVTK